MCSDRLYESELSAVAEAVVENGRALGRDPKALLDELLPYLGAFVENRVLVPAGSGDDQELRPLYESGAMFAGWKIVRCVSLVEDTEIHQLRRGEELAALKAARIVTPRLRALFDNEASVLRQLDGSGVAPRLLDAGVDDERPFLIVEWVAGTAASTVAAQRSHDRASLLALCASIAGAYATLHERGVVHGDVHSGNILAGDAVVLIDFGYARLLAEPPRVGRGGTTSLFEPEYAAAWRQGTSLPASPAGEQYALAAVLYRLITGADTIEFRYDQEEMLRQVEEEPPLPFAARGLPPWPAVERVLFRALEKDPARRFRSVAEMAALLADAREEAMETGVSAGGGALLSATLRSLAPGGERFATGYMEAPTASVVFGSAGASAALLHIGRSREDAALGGLAGVWAARAAAAIGADWAFYAAGTTPRERVGDVSPYYTEAGIHAVAAMVAAAKGDPAALRVAIADFVRASDRPCANLDLILGRSGSLLFAAMLLQLGDGGLEGAMLRAFGSGTMNAIWSELDSRPVLVECDRDPYLGMAHGWAGYLYAALRWCAASGDPLPARLAERLEELASLRNERGRGVCWPTSVRSRASLTGWCNGTGGSVFLMTLAHRLFGDERWLRLAEFAAWNEWDEPCEAATLCCGTAGRAYALLHLYNYTGAGEWLSRARQLANHAAANAVSTPRFPVPPGSLWKGDLGVAILIADLERPERARMPFFE